MAEKVEIHVSISPDGQVTIETRGLKGATCLTETEALEKTLGKVLSRQKTPDAYAQTGRGSTVRNKTR